MLYDKARIFVQAGGGGNGCLSFRREAHVPRGGPDGGDGGHGGDVVLLCDDALRDLQPFKRRAHFRAQRGRHGEGAAPRRRGRGLVIRVPPGTQVTAEDGTVHDLTTPGRRVVVAHGGSGGRGNKRFAGSTHQAPRFAERGLAGGGLAGPAAEAAGRRRARRAAQRRQVVAAVAADARGAQSGGLPVHDARAGPRHAGEARQLVVADIPGLIEGASRRERGWGHEFLAHVERTRLFVHVLDLAPLDGSDPGELRDGGARAGPARRAASPCRASSRSPRPTSWRPRPRRRPPASGALAWAGVPVVDLVGHRAGPSTTWRAELPARCRCRSRSTSFPRTTWPSTAFRPALARRGFEVERGGGRLQGDGRAGRAPPGPPRPRQRGRARPRRAPPAPDGRRPCA